MPPRHTQSSHCNVLIDISSLMKQDFVDENDDQLRHGEGLAFIAQVMTSWCGVRAAPAPVVPGAVFHVLATFSSYFDGWP